MERLLKKGFDYQICEKDLRLAITQVRGIDKRTFKQWEQTLQDLEYLSIVNRSLHSKTYEMNVAKVPNLFSILRTIPQTHLSSSTHTQDSTTTKK